MKDECSISNLLMGCRGVLRNIGLWAWGMLAVLGILLLVMCGVFYLVGQPPRPGFFSSPLFIISQVALAAAVGYGIRKSGWDLIVGLVKLIGFVGLVGGGVCYSNWVGTHVPAAAGNWFRVFSLGHAGVAVRLEMVPAQLVVALVSIAAVVFVGGMAWCALEETCKYGNKLHEAKAKKTAT